MVMVHELPFDPSELGYHGACRAIVACEGVPPEIKAALLDLEQRTSGRVQIIKMMEKRL